MPANYYTWTVGGLIFPFDEYSLKIVTGSTNIRIPILNSYEELEVKVNGEVHFHGRDKPNNTLFHVIIPGPIKAMLIELFISNGNRSLRQFFTSNDGMN